MILCKSEITVNTLLCVNYCAKAGIETLKRLEGESKDKVQ